MSAPLRPAMHGCGVLLMVLVLAGHGQERSGWTIAPRALPTQGRVVVASTFSETRSSHTTSYALSLICGQDRRQVSISSGRALTWLPSMRDPRDSYVPVELSIDDVGPLPAVLLRETDGTGQLASPMRVSRDDVEIPRFDAILQQHAYGFGRAGLPSRRFTVVGLAEDPVEFRFDNLTARDREAILKLCFAIDEHTLAQTACKKEARANALQAYEAEVHEVNRAWCDSTRDARRQQLIERFLRGVTAARNGGARLASVFAEFIASNPDVVMPAPNGATQSCPDPHFLIDTPRLRPVLERTASPEVAARHMEELLKEAGVVVSSVGSKFDPPQPSPDRRAWAAAIEDAEAKCNAYKAERQRD